MEEGRQEVAAILPILCLLLEGRMGMNVGRYFRLTYTIVTDGYKWDENLDKVIKLSEESQLENIVTYFIKHSYNYIARKRY